MSDADEISDQGSRAPGAIFALLIIAFLLLAMAFIFGSLPEFSPYQPAVASWSVDAVTSAIFLFALAAVLWLALPPRTVPDELAKAEPLCPTCFDPYRQGVHFCPHCAAPLTCFAATGWYESVHARAWCLGRAMHGPSRPLHVVGLSLFVAAYVGFFLVVLLSEDVFFEDTWGSIGLFGEAIMLWIYYRLLRRCIANLDSDDPDQLDPDRGAYGSPPWWTYDRDWALSEPPS